jgi:hypothetical protein
MRTKKEAGTFQPLFAYIGHCQLSATQSVVARHALHERVGLCLKLSPHIRIRSQERLQLVMIVDELPIPEKLRVRSQTRGNSRMTIQELIEFAQVRARIQVALPRHDPIWIFSQLSTDPRIVSQEVVELVMSANPSPVIGQ